MHLIEKLALIFSAWIMALITTPLELDMIQDQNLQIVLVCYKIWLFVVVPIVLLKVKEN